MNGKLKIFQIKTTKIRSISPRNLSERKDLTRMIKNGKFLMENGQNGDFSSKNITRALPTLKEMI
ncbi:MAG: hypothetical protein EU529_15160 [Promethearchaeota archaeon]|nr:MAG: hypothetical protein EU529_15160 [Candidatus Lokiarchaeota archaeon]